MEVREKLKSNFCRTIMHMEARSFDALVDVAKRHLAEGCVDALMNETLFSLYAALPSTWRVKSEADAKRYFQLFMKMLGADVRTEQTSARGCADAYKGGRRPVTLIGVNFRAKKRNIDEPLIESL